jgi:hypothetical protein
VVTVEIYRRGFLHSVQLWKSNDFGLERVCRLQNIFLRRATEIMNTLVAAFLVEALGKREGREAR